LICFGRSLCSKPHQGRSQASYAGFDQDLGAGPSPGQWRIAFGHPVFGRFLAWAVLDRISVKRRERAGLAMPYVHKPGTPVANDLIVVVIGATAYVAIALWLHPILFGVAAMG
jgi:hypothetical protein